MKEGSIKNRIGVVVGVAIFLILFAGLFFGVEDNPFRKPYLRFTILFDDVAGVQERARVTFLGIPVGYVSQLDYVPGPRATAVRVQIVITRRIKIPALVEAHLEPTLLGDSSIALRLPTTEAKAEETTDGPLLANDAQIEGHRSTKIESVLPGFDNAMARVESLGSSTAQRLTDLGGIIDQGMQAMKQLFLDPDASGRSKVDSLVGSLKEIIDGPEGKKNASIAAQLQTIVSNLSASSESVRQLVDIQNKERGSIGQMLQTFESAAQRLAKDADSAQAVLGKIGRASDAVAAASEQARFLGSNANQVLRDFNERPFHYLTTTRSSDRLHPGSPSPTPKH